jgi:hypothetical protein
MRLNEYLRTDVPHRDYHPEEDWMDRNEFCEQLAQNEVTLDLNLGDDTHGSSSNGRTLDFTVIRRADSITKQSGNSTETVAHPR